MRTARSLLIHLLRWKPPFTHNSLSWWKSDKKWQCLICTTNCFQTVIDIKCMPNRVCNILWLFMLVVIDSFLQGKCCTAGWLHCTKYAPTFLMCSLATQTWWNIPSLSVVNAMGPKRKQISTPRSMLLHRQKPHANCFCVGDRYHDVAGTTACQLRAAAHSEQFQHILLSEPHSLIPCTQ